MVKKSKAKPPKDPKLFLQYLMNNPIKQPHANLMNALKKVNVNSERAKKNEASMITAEGKEIIYLITKDEP